MKRLFIALVGAALVTLGSQAARATVLTEIVFVVDGSGSISSPDWDLQMTGYHNAIDSLIPVDGSVAMGIVQFATGSVIEQSMTTISSFADRAAFADLFLGLTQLGGSTCISCGIEDGESMLGTFGTTDRSIIDVSTDGAFNVGVDPNGPAGTVGTAEWAVANDATVVNAIGIGVTPDFAHGPGSFAISVNNFSDFGAAIATKIEREVIGVPEPGTLLAFGAGLLGLGLIRRRRG